MKLTNIYGTTINIDKKNIIRNESGAAFYKNLDGMESYYHICDDIQPQYMPEIFKHDIKSELFIISEHINIKYCPLCGKKL